MPVKTKKADILFAVIITVYFLIILVKFFMAPYGFSPSFKIFIELARYPLVLFAIVHSVYTLRKKAILFFILAFAIPLLTELLGVYAGADYYTSFMWGPRVLGRVPLIIPLQWFANIYICYFVINYIFSRDRKNLWLPVVLILSCGYGLCNMAIDMGRELVSVHLGQWVWPEGGAYFGVPLGNFLGWFLVALVVTFIFLFYESRISKEPVSTPDFYPSIVYFLLFLNTVPEALAIRHPEYALIEAATMLPFVLIALLVASRNWKGGRISRRISPDTEKG